MKLLKIAVQLFFSLAVSAVFVWLSLRHTDLRAVWSAIAAADPVPLLGYLVILLVVHLVRTVRWGLLLEPMGHVGFRRLNQASAVGFMMLVLLPLRLGELARPILVARPDDRGGPRIPRSGALASCVVERVVDGLAVGFLGIVALHLLGETATGFAADFARKAAWLVTAGFFGLLVVLVLAFVMRERVTGLLRRSLGRVAPRLADRLAWMLDTFIGALHMGTTSRLVAVLALTVLHWALHVAGFAMTAAAFGIHLSPLMACTVLAVQVVGVMVPAGPGMVGTSQFFTQAGLSIFFPGALSAGAVAARAAGYGNAIWLLQFGQQVLLGLIFWVPARIRLATLFAPGEARWDDRSAPFPGSPTPPKTGTQA